MKAQVLEASGEIGRIDLPGSFSRESLAPGRPWPPLFGAQAGEYEESKTKVAP